MNNETLFTLKQLRQAWGAGRANAIESFEKFLEQEVDLRISNHQNAVCTDCHLCEACPERGSTIKLQHCRQALITLIQDVSDEGIIVEAWVRRQIQ